MLLVYIRLTVWYPQHDICRFIVMKPHSPVRPLGVKSHRRPEMARWLDGGEQNRELTKASFTDGCRGQFDEAAGGKKTWESRKGSVTALQERKQPFRIQSRFGITAGEEISEGAHRFGMCYRPAVQE